MYKVEKLLVCCLPYNLLNVQVVQHITDCVLGVFYVFWHTLIIAACSFRTLISQPELLFRLGPLTPCFAQSSSTSRLLNGQENISSLGVSVCLCQVWLVPPRVKGLCTIQASTPMQVEPGQLAVCETSANR